MKKYKCTVCGAIHSTNNWGFCYYCGRELEVVGNTNNLKDGKE